MRSKAIKEPKVGFEKQKNSNRRERKGRKEKKGNWIWLIFALRPLRSLRFICFVGTSIIWETLGSDVSGDFKATKCLGSLGVGRFSQTASVSIGVHRWQFFLFFPSRLGLTSEKGVLATDEHRWTPIKEDRSKIGKILRAAFCNPPLRLAPSGPEGCFAMEKNSNRRERKGRKEKKGNWIRLIFALRPLRSLRFIFFVGTSIIWETLGSDVSGDFKATKCLESLGVGRFSQTTSVSIGVHRWQFFSSLRGLKTGKEILATDEYRWTPIKEDTSKIWKILRAAAVDPFPNNPKPKLTRHLPG